MQVEDGAKAEKHLKAGPLALQPEHGDALADLSVALAMQGQDRLEEAVEILEEAEALGAAGESFTRRRYTTRYNLTMQMFRTSGSFS